MVAMYPDVIELIEYHPWRRLVFFLVGFAVCAAIAFGYVYTRAPRYIAVSQVRMTPARTLAEGNPHTPNPSDMVAFLTEVQVLTSRAVVQQAVTRLKNAGALPDLGPDPAGAAQHLLRARPIGQTQVVELSAEGREPRFLAPLLDAVAQSWRDRATRLYRQQIADEIQYLIGKADDLHQQTMAARARLDRFRGTHGISASDNEDALAADLQKLRAPYTAAQASLIQAKAQIQALQSGPNPAADASPSNPAIAELEQKAAALRDQLHDLERRFSPRDLKSDADSKNLLEQLAALDTQIAARRSEELKLAGAQLHDIQSRFDRLSSDISLMNKLVADFAADRPQYIALQGDLDRAQRLEQSMLDQVTKSQADVGERAPRLDILQAAQFTASPSSRIYALNALVALVVSLGVGALAALCSPLLDRAPAIAWTTTGPRHNNPAKARITYRADPLHEGFDSRPIKLLPSPES